MKFALSLFALLFAANVSFAQDCPDGRCPIRTVAREVVAVPVQVAKAVVQEVAVPVVKAVAAPVVRTTASVRCASRCRVFVRRCR